MALSRRDFLKATSAVGMALGLRPLLMTEEASGGEGDPSVIWLQAQGCSGCSVSLLNSITYGTAAELLVDCNPRLAGYAYAELGEVLRRKGELDEAMIDDVR